MTTCLLPLVCVLGLGAPGNEQVLDAMNYADDQAARQVWKVSPDAATVTSVQDATRRAVEVPLPFASKPTLDRVYLNRPADLDLTVPGEFRLEVACDVPEVTTGITLYFHAGAGWYSAHRGLEAKGWQTLVFPKASFQTEDKPAGWHKIDQIRIAAWHGQPKDASLRLGRLTASWHNVVIVTPGEKTDEAKAARETAGQVAAMFEELGLGADVVEEESLAGGALAKCRVAVLPYNPALSSEAVDAMVAFVGRGGKVWLSYQLPPKLAAALGFGQGKYLRQERPGQFAEIRFDAPDVLGLPEAVRQASWNIITATPDAHGARAIGQWYDDAGKPTGQPAMLLSDRGAYLTHVILPDDRDAKKQLLAAVLGRLDPALWQEMAEHDLREAGRVGHCAGLDEVAACLRAQKMPAAEKSLDEASRTLAEAKKQFDAGEHYRAGQLARDGHRRLVDAYLRGQPSLEREGRAWWTHSGTGAYPGDWDRTARELAQAGFNMIMPNMLWAGSADYASDVLPRSDVYQKYGDQIAQCVAAAKKHGLQVHVWKVNYYLSHRTPKEFLERLGREGRLQVSSDGKPIDWLCPSHPENFELELRSMIEIARKYDVDGLHFDYIRYPGRNHCYCNGCRERFAAASGRKVEHWSGDCYSGSRKEEYNDWRCEQITRLVAAVHREAKQIRPSVKISAAVFGSYPACREGNAQDWVAWVKAGYVDFLCPMDYSNSDLTFRNLVSHQLALVAGRVPIYPGIGATASSSHLSPDRVVGQIHIARSLGASGFTIFNLSETTAKTILPGVAQGATARKAVPPHEKP